MAGEIRQVAAIGGQRVGAGAALGAHHVEKGFDQMIAEIQGGVPSSISIYHGLWCIGMVMSSLNKTVALVGMMGAGKTSIGKRLAARLEVGFRDADHEIEAAAGMTVAEIFAKYGEPEFRRLERSVIARLLGEAPHVLATGGGAYMDDDTRDAMRANAFTIWLKAPIDILLGRVKKRQEQDKSRPLLNNDDMRGTLDRLLDGARTRLCPGRHDPGIRRRAPCRAAGQDRCRAHGTWAMRGAMSETITVGLGRARLRHPCRRRPAGARRRTAEAAGARAWCRW